MFQPERDRGRTIGYGLTIEHVYFFFGTREFEPAQMPEYEYAFLRQVHGTTVVEADPGTRPEADAHFTRRATRAPVAQSADCMPVLLASKNQVCAIHAGWRGVAAGTITAAARAFDEPILFAAVGPHIMAASFEVGADVAAKFPRDAWRPHADPGKTYVDLAAIARAQIAQAAPRARLFECLFDTRTTAEFHSFRRDGKDAGRNLSFVVLNA